MPHIGVASCQCSVRPTLKCRGTPTTLALTRGGPTWPTDGRPQSTDNAPGFRPKRQIMTRERHDLSPAGSVQLGPSGWGVHDGVGAYTTIPWQQSRGAERCPIQSGPKPRNPSGSQYQRNSNPPPGRSISLQIHNNWVRQPYTRHPLAYTQGEGAED